MPLWVFVLLVSSAAVVAGGLTTYYHTDHLGSPVAATNDFGEVSWEEGYKPFGERVHSELAAIDNDIWYTGKEHDWETGFTYMNARYYDPAIGRFMAIDPVGSLPGKQHTFNRYSYANNNPYRFIDPDGRSAVTAFGGLLYESGQALTGNGFDWSSVGGAFVDGYNGEGAGVGSALFEDLTTFFPAGAALGVLTKFSKLGKVAKGAKPGNYRPDRALPRDKHGNPIPDSNAPHTQLGTKKGRNGDYTQAREFDANGRPVRDIDFTDHGRPQNHPNPHQHRYVPNETGGTLRRLKDAEPL